MSIPLLAHINFICLPQLYLLQLQITPSHLNLLELDTKSQVKGNRQSLTTRQTSATISI